MRQIMKLVAAQALLALVLCMGAKADSAVTIASSKLVVISTQPTGTQILAADIFAKKTCLLNATTNYLLLGDTSGGFSISATTGSFRLSGTVASTNPAWWCLDGPTAPYQGPVYGVSGAAGDMTIGVIRER